jgi:hypothetical protein
MPAESIEFQKSIEKAWNEFKKSQEFEQNIHPEERGISGGSYGWRGNKIGLGYDVDDKNVIDVLNHEIQHQAQASGLTEDERVGTAISSNSKLRNKKNHYH